MAGASVQIKGLDKVVASLRDLRKRMKPRVEAHVSYTALYSVVVHEDMQKFHSNGMAKFLETAARQNVDTITTFIHQSIKDGMGLEEALHGAGFIVLTSSNELVPVDTGYLRGSGRVDVVS